MKAVSNGFGDATDHHLNVRFPDIYCQKKAKQKCHDNPNHTSKPSWSDHVRCKQTNTKRCGNSAYRERKERDDTEQRKPQIGYSLPTLLKTMLECRHDVSSYRYT